MKSRHVLVLLAAITLAGCHKAPKAPEIAAVLPNLPLPPGAQPLVREGGVDAMQFLFVTPVVPDSVNAFYRNALSTGVFRLINESTSGKTTSFYAEQDGPSIWVTVSPNGNEGSQVVIAGATDSTSKAMMKAKVPVSADTGTATALPPRKP